MLSEGIVLWLEATFRLQGLALCMRIHTRGWNTISYTKTKTIASTYATAIHCNIIYNLNNNYTS